MHTRVADTMIQQTIAIHVLTIFLLVRACVIWLHAFIDVFFLRLHLNTCQYLWTWIWRVYIDIWLRTVVWRKPRQLPCTEYKRMMKKDTGRLWTGLCQALSLLMCLSVLMWTVIMRNMDTIQPFPMLVATGSFSRKRVLPVKCCVDFNHI